GVRKQNYAEHKEQQKQLRKAMRAVEESEKAIERMENRLKELDELLMQPENASDMTLVTEYTSTKRALDEEVERWEELSEKAEGMKNIDN
ncbi:MAG: ABC transporter ATP-binding protein, partial [Prevotella sp.]|nr:ABC transporter ATP-binding protein [Prevotella sp.]